MKILVIGGTGVISRAIISEGIKAGHDMIALNRGLRKVNFAVEPQTILADWSDAAAFREKTAGISADVVIDMLSRTREDTQRTLTCFGGSTRQWIFTSTTSAYRKPYTCYPIREADARPWDNPAFSYAFGKARMEAWLFDKMREIDAPITIIRPSLTYGEGCANIGVLRQNANIVRRIRQGKPLLLYDDGKTVFTFTFAPDLARGYLACCLNPAAYGQDFHITSRNAADMETYYRAFGKIVGSEPRFAYLPSKTLFDLDPRQFDHIWYEKRFSHIFSLDKIKQAAPDWEPQISLEDGLRHMIAWWEAQQISPDAEKNALEDRLCARANWDQGLPGTDRV
ncbi:MAG: NAD-dependent epimerase/dehydratase family protein [Clostridia bacterium]|nr:NAD-dependent epimerase/dehydratase family protein [Clostridia bacterium]